MGTWQHHDKQLLLVATCHVIVAVRLLDRKQISVACEHERDRKTDIVRDTLSQKKEGLSMCGELDEER